MDNRDNLQTASSPQAQLSELIWGFTKAQLIYVAAKLEIADLLQDGPKDAQTLSIPAKIDARILYRLMRGLAWCGLVEHLADERKNLLLIFHHQYGFTPFQVGFIRGFRYIVNSAFMTRKI